MSIALHWFRTDLRVSENAALLKAQQSGLPVIALYVATPKQWQQHNDAPIKLDFWRRNLLCLQQELTALGIPLLFAQVPSYAEVPTFFAQLLPSLKVSQLYCNQEWPLNERQRDTAVANICALLQVAIQVEPDALLPSLTTVLNKIGEPYKVFTPFARVLRSLLSPAKLGKIRKQNLPQLAHSSLLNSIEALAFPTPQTHWHVQWPAGEAVAQKRLNEFCRNRLHAYKQQRDLPAVDGTSSLSAYLAAGVLSSSQCWQATLNCEQNDGVLTWQNELLWRDFYRYICWHYPRVCKHQPWSQQMDHVNWRHDLIEFGRWCQGNTGIPIVDAAMRQLLATGWMHNRLRMLTAMFLTKHLLIDWRWGERWFMQQLIDGDFTANNGGWQWSASTGTDAAPYFRIFNPVTQAKRFDKQGDFIRRYVPELSGLDNDSIHEPGPRRPSDYPTPIIELSFGRERALAAFAKPPR